MMRTIASEALRTAIVIHIFADDAEIVGLDASPHDTAGDECILQVGNLAVEVSDDLAVFGQDGSQP